MTAIGEYITEVTVCMYKKGVELLGSDFMEQT